MEKTQIDTIYGGVTFEQYEEAVKTATAYMNGLIGTYAIKDIIKDEHKANLKRDLALAAMVDIQFQGTRQRFLETITKQVEEIRSEAPTDPENPENENI
jgi:lysozyme family protein